MLESETKQSEISVGDLQKRVEKMADGRRYIIYYSFEKNSPVDKIQDFSPENRKRETNEESENV